MALLERASAELKENLRSLLGCEPSNVFTRGLIAFFLGSEFGDYRLHECYSTCSRG